MDVRDDPHAPRAPFSKIIAAVGALRDDEVLHLRASFEPAPLYAVLGKRGLAHEALTHATDDWSVWFRRGGAQADSREVPAEAHVGASANEEYLDVRGLEPPEPMMRTLEALESLPTGATLVQANVRIPQSLLPMLKERGFSYDIDQTQPDRVLVRTAVPLSAAFHH